MIPSSSYADKQGVDFYSINSMPEGMKSLEPLMKMVELVGKYPLSMGNIG